MYNAGQEVYIQTESDSLPFRVRILERDKLDGSYRLQRIGHRSIFWLDENVFEKSVVKQR